MQGKKRIIIINANPKTVIRKKPIERLALYVLRNEATGVAGLNIVFVNDKETTRLHRKFFHHHYTTDVISFRLDDNARRRRVEGEVYVNIDQARRQAKTYNVSVGNEVRRLVIHGILHLVGYDDNTTINKKIMRSLEDKYLRWKNH